MYTRLPFLYSFLLYSFIFFFIFFCTFLVHVHSQHHNVEVLYRFSILIHSDGLWIVHICKFGNIFVTLLILFPGRDQKQWSKLFLNLDCQMFLNSLPLFSYTTDVINTVAVRKRSCDWNRRVQRHRNTMLHILTLRDNSRKTVITNNTGKY